MLVPKPSVPRGLCDKAQRLWRETVAVYDLRADELRVLEDACREVHLVERLEAELAGASLLVDGSQGQPVANPLIQEVRQHRSVIQRLLASLKLPDDDQRLTGDGRGPAAKGAGDRSTAARKAADARWKRGA